MVETVDIELAAHHAVIEPVSGAKSGTGIFTAETDAEKQPFYRLRLNLETRRKRKRPYFQRDKCEISERSSIPMTGWWRMQSSETGLQRRNREFFEKFRPKQASDRLIAVSQSNFDRDPNQIHRSQGTFLLFRRTG